jgi:hypothetical protein
MLEMMVPPVWIEQTTCRLQGGCSTTELRRRGRRFYANFPGLSGGSKIAAGLFANSRHRVSLHAQSGS